MLGATLGIGASVDLVDAEVVDTELTAEVTADDRAALLVAPAGVPTDYQCPYPGGTCPTATLSVTVEIDGMLSGGEVFPFTFECTNGASGSGSITQEQLFAGGGSFTAVASDQVLVGDSCTVVLVPFSMGVQRVVTVLDGGANAYYLLETG